MPTTLRNADDFNFTHAIEIGKKMKIKKEKKRSQMK